MKKKLAITLLLITFSVKSQTNIKENIIGGWRVEKVIIESKNKNIIDFGNSFYKSIFLFRENRDFSFSPEKNSELILMVVNQLKDAKWIFDDRDGKFKIGTDTDNYSTMSIEIKIENDKAYFHFDETDLNLELIRIE